MHTTSSFEFPTLDKISNIAANNNPNRIAFGNGLDGREVTWAEFDAQSFRAANSFTDFVSQGDRVAFLCDCSINHVTLWDGALKAGCIVSNLHTRASEDTLAYCIDAIRPRILVIDEEFSNIAEQILSEKIATDIDAVVTTGEPQTEYEESIESFVSDDDTEPDIRRRENDIAAIMWTSGTTGRPKGWCHTHRGLSHKAMRIQVTSKIQRTTRQPHVFTPSFAAWYSLILPALYANASTYFLRNWDPESYVKFIEKRKLTRAVLVPTMWHEVLALENLSDYDLDSLTNITASGEQLDTLTLSSLRNTICDTVQNAYASTEVLGTVISNEELEGERIKSVGKPVSGTDIRIVEEGGPPDAIKSQGETGEIIIKGPDCPVWAWNDTEKTENTFEDGWWYSGDLGYKDEDGYLYLEGRTDFMVKSKGIKVFPAPIEERLIDHPHVKQAAVVGVNDEEYGEKVVAVVRRTSTTVSKEDLEEWCLQSDMIGRFERPREFIFVEHSLPQTATGKLDRSSIKRDLD